MKLEQIENDPNIEMFESKVDLQKIRLAANGKLTELMQVRDEKISFDQLSDQMWKCLQQRDMEFHTRKQISNIRRRIESLEVCSISSLKMGK